jgi:hypothetical protein
MKVRIPTALVLVCIACPAALAGSIIDLVTTEYTEDPPIIGTVEITTQGKESRIEITSVSSNESGGMIYRSDKRELIALDHSIQAYYVFDQAMMDMMAAQVQAALEQTEAALEAMPPEERALAEQMIQRPLSDEEASRNRAKLVATGESDTIAGFKCQYYDVMQSDRKIRDICMTPWKDIPQGREASQAMMELADFFERMREAFAGSGGLNLMDRQQEMFAYMEELDGYPVLSHDYDINGELESESRLQAARKEKIDAAMFEPPAGYQQRTLQ